MDRQNLNVVAASQKERRQQERERRERRQQEIETAKRLGLMPQPVQYSWQRPDPREFSKKRQAFVAEHGAEKVKQDLFPLSWKEIFSDAIAM